MTLNNKHYTTPSDICHNFANFFHSVQVNDDSFVLSEANDSLINNNVNIGNYSVSIEITYDALCNINERKGVGPDKVPPVFLNQCGTNLVVSFHIFNCSLSVGVFPAR